MRQEISAYVGNTTATPAPAVVPEGGMAMFTWTASASSSRRDPYMSGELAGAIREALAAVERGETDDLGSFAQYLDDDED